MSNGWHEDFEDCPSSEEYIPWECEDEEYFGDEDHFCEEEEQREAEEAADYLLAQQELEDLEQSDEYYNHYDYGDEF